MGSLNAASDDRLAADLLWQMKAIATKEVTSSSMITKKRKTSFSLKLPRIISTSPSISSCESLLEEDSPSPYSYNSPTPTTPTTPTTTAISVGRSRTVSVGSIDMIVPSHKHATKILIKLSPRPTTRTAESHLEHFDWSSNHRAAPGPSLASFPPSPSSLLVGVSSSPLDELPQHQPPTQHPGGKNSKRKREGFVGTAQKPEVAVRGTLRKKFSWKQYPELEEYLLSKQREYFEYSSKNYTAEQRKYNNGLTRGLLDLAAEEGYVFQDFTFSMIRDRIRCYYKSHSQLAKKKRQR